MTNISRGRKEPGKLKTMGNHNEFLKRITKSLYYTKLPMTDCLSLPVTELAAELFTEVKSGHTLERLDVEEASRISRNACVSPCSLVLALLYLERLKDCNPEYLQRVAPSELFLVSLMVASKFLNDDGEDDEVFNTEWARSGHFSVTHMNKLEKEFLQAIDWTIFVHNKEFWERLQRLEKDIAYKEGRKRGWFSYTELSYAMNTVQLLTIAQALINISCICLATYAAGIATLLGSALVASYVPGTVLESRQTAPTINATKTQLSPMLNTNSLTSDPIPNEILTVDYYPPTPPQTCNRTETDCRKFEVADSVNHWEWWLNSVMAWLPEHSGLNIDQDVNKNNKETQRTDIFITSTYLLKPTLIQDADELITEIKWKQIFGVDLKLLLHDWRNYASYVTKITLGYQF